MICGVDEAGKGPVIGPLVVAAVKINNARDIENMGFKDSKILGTKKRKELAKIIKTKFDYAVEIIEPKIIDKYTKQNKLNQLNREAFERLISKLNPLVAYVDAADVNEKRFGIEIKRGLRNENDTDVISLHKADRRIPIVAAASIIAKETSENQIGKLPLEVCETINGSWGFNLQDRKHKSKEKLIQYLQAFLYVIGPKGFHMVF